MPNVYTCAICGQKSNAVLCTRVCERIKLIHKVIAQAGNKARSHFEPLICEACPYNERCNGWVDGHNPLDCLYTICNLDVPLTAIDEWIEGFYPTY